MIYFIVATITVIAFWLGYLWGHDKGYKAAHARIVAQSLVRTQQFNDERAQRRVSGRGGLRLVKGQIIRD